jgi:WD domain, G-beta repeat
MEKFTLNGHTERVYGVAITPDGRQAISASGDSNLKIWDLETGLEKNTLTGHFDHIKVVAITPDGCLAVSGVGGDLYLGKEKTIRVWDLETGREKFTLVGHTAEIHAMGITPDGRLAVSASADSTIKVWDLENGRCLTTYFAEEPLACNPGLLVEPFRIIIGDRAGRIHFLQMENLELSEPIVTAWNSISLPENFGQKLSLAFGCPYCHTWPEIQRTALGGTSPCPHCNKPIRFNPFIIAGNWRTIAHAWQG